MSFNKLWLLLPVIIVTSYMNCGKLEGNGVGGTANLGSFNSGQNAIGNDNLIFSSLRADQISIGREIIFSTNESLFAEPVAQVFWDHNLDGTGFCTQTDGDTPWSFKVTCTESGTLNVYLIIEYASGVDVEYVASVNILQEAQQPVNPTPTPTPPPPLNGANLYSISCAGCHGPGATTGKRNRSQAQIQTAINNNVGGMGNLSNLTAAEVAAIAAYLNQ